MIENLRLDDSATLSTSNTNNPSLPLINASGGTSNHLSPTIDPAQEAWCNTQDATCYDKSMLTANNTSLFVNAVASGQNGDIYRYGNYYNWYSATAGNGVYSVSSGNVAGDLCPAGWRLPTGGSVSDEFSKLDIALGGTGAQSNGNNTTPTGYVMSAAYRAYPNNFIKSGFVSGSSLSYRNTTGGYWSSTIYNSNLAYALTLGDNYVTPSGYNARNLGRSIRCLSKN